MAGNPFRRPKAPPSLSLGSSETNFPPDQDVQVADASRRPSKTKRVRIATPPPISPDPETPIDEDTSIYRIADESHEGSPPPILDGTGTEPNPFEKAFPDVLKLQDPEVIENTRRNSATGSADPVIPTAVASVPANPFARTLATIEKGEHGSTKQADSATKRDKPNAMDMESFTRMLMTGNAPPQPSQSHSATTDSDSPPGISASESEDGEDTPVVQSTKIGNSSKTRAKPPPPVHRHGKSVAERAPQTVSFADFGFEPTTENTATKGRPGIARSPSDYNKPLPGLPQGATQETLPITSGSTAGRQHDASSVLGPGKGAKPPPPPPARRGAKPVSREGGRGGDDAVAQADHGEQDPTSKRRSMANVYGTSSSRSSSQHSSRLSMGPPPPPRRRGSSKSSLDTPAPLSAAGGALQDNRVLDDLAALQAEVDALRAQQHR